MEYLDALIEFYGLGSQQGPGDAECTRRAFELLGELPRSIRILDIGCGPGLQTAQLAALAPASELVAVDTHGFFERAFKENVSRYGLRDRVAFFTASALELPFRPDEFDLVWSEGAAYMVGFLQAIREWGRWLKTGGFLTASELSWLRGDVPEELADYWTRQYPEMDTISAKIAMLEKNGYAPMGHFVLPEHALVRNFYQPLQAKKSDFLRRFALSPVCCEVVEEFEREVALYERYSAYYGYVFYLAKKI